MNTLQLCMELGELPQGRFDVPSEEFIAKRLAESPTGDIRLMEMVCERENMRRALLRVEKNAGAPGVDGMKTSQLRGYMKQHWEEIKATLLDGTYKPSLVLRKEIPKPDGGIRPLGIPTVLDRCIQQAIAQILQELWDHTFSEHSYGFRPGRSQHMAILQAKCYVEEGYTHVVDIDLSKFFDRVNHRRLMSRLAQRITDKRMLRIIRAFLNSGILIGDIIEEPGEGTPQGGPLSPLLANIVLDELDKELEKRGLRFVRYADDCVIYVKSKRAAERVMGSISRVITWRLKLKVNEAKSSVTHPWLSRYLGYRITRMFGATRIGIHQKSIKRFKERIREVTARDRGRSIMQIVSEINSYMRGWWAYFRIGGSGTIIKELNSWLLRRLRAYVWKQWKLPRTKIRELERRGVCHYWAVIVGNSRKSTWRMSRNGQVIHALPEGYFTSKLGLFLLG